MYNYIYQISTSNSIWCL